MITAGIDIGAKNTKTIILADRKIAGAGIILTGFDIQKAAERSLEAAIFDAGAAREDIREIFATGSGRNGVKMATHTVNDIKAMGKGAHYFFPNAGTVADVGAEEGRAATIDGTGRPVDFVVNERCAAGAGAFIESMGRILEIPLEEMGPLALTSEREIPINAQCAIFAESDTVGLLHARTEKRDISKAIHDAMAGRIVSMIRRLGIHEDVVMLGGVGYNPAFMEALKRELKLDRIRIPGRPEFGAAVGAAILAAEAGVRP